MHLRSRIIILCGLFLALEIGFLYAFYRWDLSQKIFRAEKQQLEKNLGRNMEFLRKELLQLEQTSKLIASLNLLKNASNNDYFQNIMLQQELNLLYIVDDSNQVLFGKIIDLDLLTPFPNEAFLLSLWKEKPQFLKTETLQSQSGIYNSVLGPMLIVSTPFSNQQTTEIAGTLLIGKLLTTEFVQMMRDIIFTNASFWPLEGATLSKKHLDVLNQLIKTDGNFLVEKNDDSLQGYVALSDINQKYNLLLSNIQPRDFRNLAINGLLFISSVVLLIQILLMGIIFWLIGRYTHDPMKALIEQLDSHQSGDNAIILSQQSWGELEPLIESLSHYIANAHQKSH